MCFSVSWFFLTLPFGTLSVGRFPFLLLLLSLLSYGWVSLSLLLSVPFGVDSPPLGAGSLWQSDTFVCIHLGS